MNRKHLAAAIALCAIVTLAAGWTLLVPHPQFQPGDLVVNQKYLNATPEAHLMAIMQYDAGHDRYRIAACSMPNTLGEVRVHYDLSMWYERPWLEEDFVLWGYR